MPARNTEQWRHEGHTYISLHAILHGKRSKGAAKPPRAALFCGGDVRLPITVPRLNAFPNDIIRARQTTNNRTRRYRSARGINASTNKTARAQCSGTTANSRRAVRDISSARAKCVKMHSAKEVCVRVQRNQRGPSKKCVEANRRSRILQEERHRRTKTGTDRYQPRRLMVRDPEQQDRYFLQS